jgi:hypothetical protein
MPHQQEPLFLIFVSLQISNIQSDQVISPDVYVGNANLSTSKSMTAQHISSTLSLPDS